jgi:hypothetical protein
MLVEIKDAKQFEKKLAEWEGRRVFVFAYTPWAGPCRRIEAFLEEEAEKLEQSRLAASRASGGASSSSSGGSASNPGTSNTNNSSTTGSSGVVTPLLARYNIESDAKLTAAWQVNVLPSFLVFNGGSSSALPLVLLHGAVRERLRLLLDTVASLPFNEPWQTPISLTSHCVHLDSSSSSSDK